MTNFFALKYIISDAKLMNLAHWPEIEDLNSVEVPDNRVSIQTGDKMD